MNTVAIENGKRIDELVEIHHLTGPSYFLVSDVNITRRISLDTLRNEFNGDEAVDNLTNVYYSVDKINELLQAIRGNANDLSNRLDLTDSKYSDYYNDIVSEIASIWRDVEDRYEFLFKWIDTLDAREARHYENLCEWMYKLRNDLRERLRDLDYREQSHWVNQENRLMSLEYRMTECDMRLDDLAVRTDDIEVWKNIVSSFKHIKYKGNSVNNTNDFDNILTSIDDKLDDLNTRVTNIEVWKTLNFKTGDLNALDIDKLNSSTSLRQIIIEIDSKISGVKATADKVDAQLAGYSIAAGPSAPSSANYPNKTIYFQYFNT